MNNAAELARAVQFQVAEPAQTLSKIMPPPQ